MKLAIPPAPLASTAADVDRLIAASETSGKTLAIFQQSRFAPYFRQDFLLLRENRTAPLRHRGRGLLHRLDVLAMDVDKRLVVDLRQINLLRHIGEHIHDCLVGHFSLLVSVDLCVELFALPTSLFGSHHSQTSFD